MEMKSGAVVQASEKTAQERQDFYGRIGKENLAPLWEVLKGIVPSQPSPQMVPYLWDFDALKKFVLESGGLLTAEEAERRVLVLENPTLRGKSLITDVLYGGMWAAAATPKPILDKLRKALADTLKDPAFVATLKKAGQAPYEGDHVKFFASMREVEVITREDYKKFKLEPQ